MAAVAAGTVLASGAYAQNRAPDEAALRSLFPGLQIKPANGPGAFELGEWRASLFSPSRNGFSLSLHWNGIDDEKWPFEKLVAGLAGRYCGKVSASAIAAHLEKLYKTKSLVRERELGGNAGSTFKRRLSARVGACRAVFVAEGARWHTLRVNVTGK
ncbi:MAG: hypothetical protein AB7F96_17025 [Beijerinckiaceae bacterium]